MHFNNRTIISRIRKGFNQNLPVPKYYQFKELIKKEIEKGSILPDEQLPSICCLSDEFGITAVTAGRVLRELENEGFAKRIKGKGTYARMPVDGKRLADTIGTVLPWSRSHGPHEAGFDLLIHGIEESIHRNGFEMVYSNSHGSVELEKKHMERLSGKTEGLIVFLTGEEEKTIAEEVKLVEWLKGTGLPFVIVDKHFEDVPSHFVETDNRLGAQMAVSRLLDQGCRRIGCLFSCHSRFSSIADRLRGYDETLKARNLDAFKLLISHGDVDMRAGLSAFLRDNRLDGIFACESWMSDLAADIALEEGIEIPDKLK
ncbi:MAG: GntR family transcriptional regulator, partial [Victivallales bacterium]